MSSRGPDWHPLIERLNRIPTVFAIGFQTDRGLAAYFARIHAHECSLPVALMTDPLCDWGQQTAAEIFAVDTPFGQFREATAHLGVLTNLMLQDIFPELGEVAGTRLQKAAGL